MRRHILGLALLAATSFTLSAKEKVDITKLTIESEGEETDIVWVGEPVKFKAEIDCKDPNSTVKYAWKDDVADASPNDQLVATKTFSKASTSVGAHKATFEVTGDSSGNPTSSKNFTVVSFEPAFPPEIRIGEKAGRNKDTVSLEIKPAGVNLDFSSTKPGTADVSPATGSGKVTLTITGKKLSTADQDTKVQAKYKGKTLGDVTVTVVEPRKIRKASPPADGQGEIKKYCSG